VTWQFYKGRYIYVCVWRARKRQISLLKKCAWISMKYNKSHGNILARLCLGSDAGVLLMGGVVTCRVLTNYEMSIIVISKCTKHKQVRQKQQRVPKHPVHLKEIQTFVMNDFSYFLTCIMKSFEGLGKAKMKIFFLSS